MLLTWPLVGAFYAVFSIFIRSIFPVDACLSVTHISTVLENFYQVILFITLLVSTTRNVDKSEAYY